MCLEASNRCLVERKVRQIPFRGTRPGRASRAAGGLSRIGVEKHGQPSDCPFIEFSPATHITDPSREVGHHDQLLSQPGEISDMP